MAYICPAEISWGHQLVNFMHRIDSGVQKPNPLCLNSSLPKFICHFISLVKLSFLTFNFMDENEKATQINFLRCSHRVTDCTPEFKASFLRGGKERREAEATSNLLICMHNPCVWDSDTEEKEIDLTNSFEN